MPQITVSGTIANINNSQYKIVKFWESYDFKGQERHRIWTAWMDSDVSKFAEGDFITIEGDLSTKVSTYNKPGEDTRQVVEHSLNNCTVETHRPKVAAAPQATIEDDELPF